MVATQAPTFIGHISGNVRIVRHCLVNLMIGNNYTLHIDARTSGPHISAAITRISCQAWIQLTSLARHW